MIWLFFKDEIMALIGCVECGKDVSDTANNCPNCGAKVKKQGGMFWAYVLMMIFFGFLVLLVIGSSSSNSSNSTEKIKARDAIDYCWKEHDRKSLGAPEKQFVAGACEKMESDFTANFGQKP